MIAIAAQLKVHRDLGFSLVNFFSYFTNLSNVFAGAVSTVRFGRLDVLLKLVYPLV